MSDYISREDAIEAIRKAENHAFNSFYKGLVKAHKIVADLSPADVVPVVRCKDCEHNNDCDIQYSAQAGDNFFCGFGKTEKKM